MKHYQQKKATSDTKLSESYALHLGGIGVAIAKIGGEFVVSHKQHVKTQNGRIGDG